MDKNQNFQVNITVPNIFWVFSVFQTLFYEIYMYKLDSFQQLYEEDYYYPHFTGEETKALISTVICPES